MTDSQATLDKLSEFAARSADIQYVVPSSPAFEEMRTIYAHPEIVPLAILRPRNVQAVAAAVSFLASNKVDFTVRGGGHDMHGRSMKNKAVALDLRLINHVQIDTASSTAKVGGGALLGDVAQALQQQGLITPIGSISRVGYTGWAMYGGYGSYSSRFGLGVDQIVGAKVINAQGEPVEADADLLKAIRGAGGAFGVIVELTISIYKLDRILSGVLLFKSDDDLPTVVRQYNEGYRALLSAEGMQATPLSIQQFVLNMPTPTFGLLFMWASEDLETGNQWVERLSTLGPVTANTVQSRTPLGWLHEQDRLVAKSTQGQMFTISVRAITAEVADVIARYTNSMPADPHIIFDMHELRDCSPSAKANAGSVFSAREGHFMCEITAIVEDRDNLEATLAWGREFREALRKTSAENIVPASYVSFLTCDDFEPDRIYGNNLRFLKRVKKRADPENTFQNAISYLEK